MDEYTQGNQITATHIASDFVLFRQAEAELQDRKYSRTSFRPREACLIIWHKIMIQAGVSNPFDIALEAIISGAAIVISAGYRSTMAYVDIAVQKFLNYLTPRGP